MSDKTHPETPGAEQETDLEITVQVMQISQNILVSFIRQQGLTSEFKAYVANYDMGHSVGQAVKSSSEAECK